MIGHISSFTVGGETKGAQRPLGSKRPWREPKGNLGLCVW